MSKYRLTYFDARGRGEIARLLCAAAGKDFEDIRIPADDLKKNSTWLSIKERTPFGQIPMLEVNDEFTLAQSHTIERFLAREFDMMGKDAMEAAEVDMFIEAVGDLIRNLIRYQFIETDEEIKAKIKRQFLYDTGATVLSLYEGRIAINPSGFTVGDSLTLADIGLFDLRTWVSTIFPDDYLLFLGPYGNCTNNSKLVSSVPGVAAWLKKRPNTAF